MDRSEIKNAQHWTELFGLKARALAMGEHQANRHTPGSARIWLFWGADTSPNKGFELRSRTTGVHLTPVFLLFSEHQLSSLLSSYINLKTLSPNQDTEILHNPFIIKAM